jgi:hypothetical protein
VVHDLEDENFATVKENPRDDPVPVVASIERLGSSRRETGSANGFVFPREVAGWLGSSCAEKFAQTTLIVSDGDMVVLSKHPR